MATKQELIKIQTTLETDIERMLMECMLLKSSYESIDMYIDDVTSESKMFVVKLTTRIPITQTRHFRDASFFQSLKRAQNHLYYRDENNNSKYV